VSRFFAIYTGEEERLFKQADLPLAIGSGKSCQIPLAGGAEVVATIDQQEGKYLFLKPASDQESIFHNDQLITSSAWIKSGDQTRIGDRIIVYRISGDRVEIIIKRYTVQEPANNHNTGEQQAARLESAPLPSVPTVPDVPSGKLVHTLLTGFIFIVLLLSALFVLTARTLEISIEPPPDTIRLQGQLPLIHLGKKYLGMKGVYQLQAGKTGFQDLQEKVIIANDKPSRYIFSLKPLPGYLDVTSVPDGVEVWFDKTLLGKTPLKHVAVDSGSHTLSCRAALFKEINTPIDITAGRQLDVNCDMQPYRGRIFLVSDPAGATVFEKHTNLGKTPLTLELDPGTHSLVIQENTYAPATVELQVKGGETLTPPVIALHKNQPELTLNSHPEGALVFEGKKRLGTTPLHLRWQTGSKHSLRFTLKGYKEKTIEFVANTGLSRKKLVRLTPKLAKIKIKIIPPSATLYIDGRKQKKNSGTFTLSTQKHTIEARAKGYASQQKLITPDTQKTRSISISLTKKITKIQDKQSAQLPAHQTEETGKTPVKTMLVRLEPGEFIMGSSRREAGRRANEGRHRVVLTRPFFLAVHEVTNAEYRSFAPNHHAGNIDGQSLDKQNFPVVKVNWQDAAAYCNWLSRKEGLAPFYTQKGTTYVAKQPLTNGYRLPFEAEWEFAARKVARTRPGSFPWDGRFPPRHPSGNYADEAARTLLPGIIEGYHDGFPVLAPVANFPRNMAGLFDMGGNVAEWCHDWYSPVIVPMSGKVIDPTGPASGTYHVYRGSSWRDGHITELRIPFRGYANTAKDSLGFRVARFAQ
jgi:formylglycine-generating enzyme required for sulfatase activity